MYNLKRDTTRMQEYYTEGMTMRSRINVSLASSTASRRCFARLNWPKADLHWFEFFGRPSPHRYLESMTWNQFSHHGFQEPTLKSDFAQIFGFGHHERSSV